MRLEAVTPKDWATRLLPAWNDLLAQASEPSVFLSPEWILAWWRAYGHGLVPRLLAAWEAPGRLAGLAPLYRRRLRWLGLPGPWAMRVMGDEQVGSEYLGFLVRPGREEQFLGCLAAAIECEWAVLDLGGLREGGPLARLVPREFGARANGLIYFERDPCSLIPLPDNYETYVASLKQKFRSMLRYETKKLLKTSAVRLIRTSTEEQIDPHLERFFALHQARWEAKGHPGSFHDLHKRAFYREIAAGFLRRGWLRFYHLEVDGVIRASQFGFVHKGVLHALQEAFDHTFHPPGIAGVGVVLRGMAIRESISEGLTAYDFLGGSGESKARWGTTTHHVQRVRIGSPGLAGVLAFCGTAGLLMAKAWVRAHIPCWALQARAAWRNRQGRRLLGLGMTPRGGTT